MASLQIIRALHGLKIYFLDLAGSKILAVVGLMAA